MPAGVADASGVCVAVGGIDVVVVVVVGLTVSGGLEPPPPQAVTMRPIPIAKVINIAIFSLIILAPRWDCL